MAYHEIAELRRALRHKFSAYMRAFSKEVPYPNAFKRFIKEKHMCILHAHFGNVGCQTVHLKRELGLPLVTSFYGIDASRLLDQPGMKRHFKRLFLDGDVFVVLGNRMVKQLQGAGCPLEKIRIVHLGIAPEEVPFRQRVSPPPHKPIVLLYCGRLVEKKGIFDALYAFSQLAKKKQNLEFHIIGDGPLRADLEHDVRRQNLQHRVKMRGALKNQDVIKAMGNAHLFILPSFTASNGDMEGTPMVLLEAQASGLPILSTLHADIPEAVVDGQTGLLVPERDRRALTDRLAELLNKSEMWPEMGKAGRQHVEQNYNIHIETTKLEAVYRELVDSEF